MNPNQIGSGAVVAVLVAELMEMAKRSPRFAAMNIDSESLNRFVGGLAAFASGLGLQFHFDAAQGQLVVDGLVATGLIHGFAQWSAQQAYYRLAIQKGVQSSAPVNQVTEH
ncbi:hypothetical protein UFOVP509_6 [uncultured Caudovirales phage]|uniref:Uncharacterized protein n=1 Tax=uncultured Caudovirales phage TaxID=2100421 RepID=A0A6J5MPD5_9CAUD|nr:hypothetical protein UFOVP509_6 [uncultured Caudovirales phage]